MSKSVHNEIQAHLPYRVAEMASSVSSELLEAIVRVCQRVQRLVASYEEGREPDKLDCLVYHVDRLHRILLAINACSNNVLESVGMSLTLLEELNRAQSSLSGSLPSS